MPETFEAMIPLKLHGEANPRELSELPGDRLQTIFKPGRSTRYHNNIHTCLRQGDQSYHSIFQPSWRNTEQHA